MKNKFKTFIKVEKINFVLTKFFMFFTFKKFNYQNYDIGFGGKLISKNFKGIDLFRFSFFYKSIVWDLSKKLPLRLNSAKYIYSSHAIEHLPVKDGKRLLEDIYLTLKDQGVLRIVCPDASKFVDLYLKDGGERFSNGVSSLMYLAQESEHKSIWDAKSLISFLKKLGFKKVSEVSCGKTLNNFPVSNEFKAYEWQSVYVEAVK